MIAEHQTWETKNEHRKALKSNQTDNKIRALTGLNQSGPGEDRHINNWPDLNEKNSEDLRFTFSINLKFNEKKKEKNRQKLSFGKGLIFSSIDCSQENSSHGCKYREISLHPGLYYYRNAIRHGQRSLQSRSWTVCLACATAPLANTPIGPRKSGTETIIRMVSKE